MQTITKKDLKHIPGDWGIPFFGHFFTFVADATNFYKVKQDKYGDVFKMRTPLGNSVALVGSTANKLILVEEGKFTSSKEAWEMALGDLFPNGLMLMDGDKHKYHRGIMQDAFKKDALQGYMDIMPEIIAEAIDELDGKEKVLAFPYFKNLTLKVAARVFFGLDSNADLKNVNKAITDIVNASAALPIKLPFTKYQKGINGRKFLIQYFKELLPKRRNHPGKDLFSKFCQAESEEGDRFTDQEIIDHLIFVLMAAHDTTAITLTLMSYFIAKYPEWQNKLRTEIQAFSLTPDTKFQDLRELENTGLVMKETLRYHPPLITVSRKLEKELEVNDIKIPQNTFVNVVFQVTHHDESFWTDPEKFDPERFNKERNEQARCPFGYAPFGAGKHHCIGYQFAEIMVKLGMHELLSRFRLSVPENYEMPVQDVPLKQPKDNLPLYLEKINH